MAFSVMVPSDSPAEVWKERGNARVRVFYHVGDEENVSSIVKALDDKIPDVEEKLGIVLSYEPKVFLTSSYEEFDRAVGGLLPEWSQGISFAETGTIILKSPKFSEDIATLRRTAVHELVHLMIADRTGHAIPRWLNEGLAQMLSGEAQEKTLMPLSRAFWSHELLPLNSIEQVDSFTQPQAELAYLESFNATEFLVNRYGWETLRKLLKDMNEGLSWDEALFREMQIDQAEFESGWSANLGKSYRWMILLDTQTYLFIGATLLVLVAGLAVIRRRRAIYRRWETEDGPDAGIF